MSIESQVLWSILDTGNLTPYTEAGLRPALFSTLRTEVEWVFEWATKHQKPPSVERFKEKFEGTPLLPTKDSPSEMVADLASAYADMATRAILQRATLSSARGHARLDELREAVSAVVETITPSTDTELYGEDFVDSLRTSLLTRQEAGGITGITTPWPSYNIATGGIQPDELIVVAARTGVGKSFLLLRMAAHMWSEGHDVLFISNELSTDVVQLRYAAIALGVDYSAMRKGAVDIDEVCMKASAMQSSAKLVVTANDGDMTVGGLSFVAAKIKRHKPKVIYIDGGYLLDDESGGRNPYEKAANIVSGLKRLNKALNIPIIVSWQLNRNAANKGAELGTEHMGLSDRVGADSSYIWAMAQNDDDKDNKVMRVFFPKKREASVEPLVLNWKFEAGMDMSELQLPNYDNPAPAYTEAEPDYSEQESTPEALTHESVVTTFDSAAGDASAFDLGDLLGAETD